MLKQTLDLGGNSVNQAKSHGDNNLPNSDKVPNEYNKDARWDIH